jgi:hypothetical protein
VVQYRAAESVEQLQDDRRLQDLDASCLQLCIALLDHTLYGDIYDSIVLSFLAVLGIRVSSEEGSSQGGWF